MIDDDALNREIDGQNSPEESRAPARGARAAARSLRARYERLVGLVRTLEAVPARRAPARPDRADHAGRSGRKARPVVPWRPLGRAVARAPCPGSPPWASGRPWPAGLVLGAFLAGVGEPSASRGRRAAGRCFRPGPGLQEVDRAVLAGEGFRREVVVRAGGGAEIELRVHLEGSAAPGSDRHLRPARAEPLGFDLRGAPAGRGACSGPTPCISWEAGAGDYVLRLGVRKPDRFGGAGPAGTGSDPGVEKTLKVTEEP